MHGPRACLRGGAPIVEGELAIQDFGVGEGGGPSAGSEDGFIQRAVSVRKPRGTIVVFGLGQTFRIVIRSWIGLEPYRICPIPASAMISKRTTLEQKSHVASFTPLDTSVTGNVRKHSEHVTAKVPPLFFTHTAA